MSYSLVDIAANLTHDTFDDDFDSVLANAQAANVKKFLVVGTDAEASEKALLLADKHPDVFWATVGLHPHHASDWSDAMAAQFDHWMGHKKCVAAGEMGLDYFRNFSSPADQKSAFEAQLELAIKHQKPAYLHVREAFDDFYPILSKHISSLPKAVVHCFTGTEAELDAYIELGCGIGITGWVCDERRGKTLQTLIPKIPDDRLMIETDCPYLLPRTLAPKPKSRRNEPKYLPEVLRVVAELRETSVELLANQLWENTHRYFDLN